MKEARILHEDWKADWREKYPEEAAYMKSMSALSASSNPDLVGKIMEMANIERSIFGLPLLGTDKEEFPHITLEEYGGKRAEFVRKIREEYGESVCH